MIFVIYAMPIGYLGLNYSIFYIIGITQKTTICALIVGIRR